jgi:hypothetical protein
VSVSVSVPFDLELMGDKVPLASMLSSRNSRSGDEATVRPADAGAAFEFSMVAAFIWLARKTQKGQFYLQWKPLNVITDNVIIRLM